jgi:beta-carotene hydroxylase
VTQSDGTFASLTEEQRFHHLKQTPAISWPALGLFLLGLTIISFASSMAITDGIPLWSGMLANGLGLYLLFSIMHDALHRNVSTNRPLNEIFGRISLFLLIPAAPIEIARWAHFQHHRFTSNDQDPDNFIHDAKGWQIPMRWSNFDLHNYIKIWRLKHEELNAQNPAIQVGFGLTPLNRKVED